VARIREWIAAGDSYQVNLTFPLRAKGFRGSARGLYSRLCRSQRSAYCAYLDFGAGAVVSASPELFFHRQAGELVLRPMKGTRPRGRWPQEDEALARELAESPKDRAENLMIVDLLRNDAGRVARFGSVRVEEMFAVERYPTVHQMTSTVRAEVGPEVTLTDLFRGLFPCGSITGAPKVRTSQLIAELEQGPRGVYTGAIGIVSPGESIFSVAIRTLCLYPGGEAVLGVGGGITHDSVAAQEYQECLDKAAFISRPPPAALLETLRYEPDGGFLRLGRHLARMGWSASVFGVRFAAAQARARLEAMVAEMPPEPRRVRMTLDQAGRIEITHAAAPAWANPVRLRLLQRSVPSSDPRWYHKSTDRSLYGVGGVEGDEPLFLNERGELAETAIANLVLELDGELFTPALACGVLPGVLRAELLDQGVVRERVLTRADLARASRIWVINSLRGWGSAVLVDDATERSAADEAKTYPAAPA
jgi:para-aminobenzoate synthetase/4-amino-4-deoxychorismate lyase